MSNRLVCVLKNSCIPDKSAFVQKLDRPHDQVSRTGDDKDSDLLLCCGTSYNISLLCSRTSASLQLKRTRFGQAWSICSCRTGRERTKSFCNKHVQGVKPSSLLILQHYAFLPVHVTSHFSRLIVLFIRDSKMNLKRHVLPR